jgi:hypothetical protein
MTTIRSKHRPRRPARRRRGLGPAIEAMEGRLALSTALPLSPPGATPVLAAAYPPQPIAPVQGTGTILHPPTPVLNAPVPSTGTILHPPVPI